MGRAFGEALPARAAVERVASGDRALEVLDLAASPSFGTAPDAWAERLAEALRASECVRAVRLDAVGITDAGATALAAALADNASVTELSLAGNKIKSPGVEAFGRALATNATLRTLKLENQEGGRALGDAALGAFITALETNVVLLKVSWRLESRASFALNRLLTRNKEIKRRLLQGRDVADLLPAGVAPPAAAFCESSQAQTSSLSPAPSGTVHTPTTPPPPAAQALRPPPPPQAARVAAAELQALRAEQDAALEAERERLEEAGKEIARANADARKVALEETARRKSLQAEEIAERIRQQEETLAQLKRERAEAAAAAKRAMEEVGAQADAEAAARAAAVKEASEAELAARKAELDAKLAEQNAALEAERAQQNKSEAETVAKTKASFKRAAPPGRRRPPSAGPAKSGLSS